MPSSPPVTNEPTVPSGAGFGLHATDQTSPVSVNVETQALAPISQTLTVLSADLITIHDTYQHQIKTMAYPESASRPSGEISTLSAHDEWPAKEVTTFPAAPLTSCRTSRLS